MENPNPSPNLPDSQPEVLLHAIGEMARIMPPSLVGFSREEGVKIPAVASLTPSVASWSCGACGLTQLAPLTATCKTLTGERHLGCCGTSSSTWVLWVPRASLTQTLLLCLSLYSFCQRNLKQPRVICGYFEQNLKRRRALYNYVARNLKQHGFKGSV